MEIVLSEKIQLENIPSGSGIIKVKDTFYVIGDDSPFLFTLNSEFGIKDRVPLIDTSIFKGNRVVKSHKPDFEALEMISETEFVIFGSGSKSPQRDVFTRILIKNPIAIENYSAAEFYDNLKSLKIFSDSELNLEAAAYRDGYIFLFNRRKNIILKFEYDELLLHLQGKTTFPIPDVTELELPQINGINAGFSGATVLINHPKMIFTASVENTDNAYDDGEILGSYIGIVDITDGIVSNSFQYCRIPDTKGQFKVESVTIEEEISSGKTKVVLIIDNDNGNSVVMKGLVAW